MTTQGLWMKLMGTANRLDPAVQELEDRRRTTRTKLLLPVSFARNDQLAHRLQHGLLRDYSQRGAFVQNDFPLEPGTALVLEIQEREAVLRRRGVVCWTRLVDSYEAPPSGMGILVLGHALPPGLRPQTRPTESNDLRLACTYQLIIEDPNEPLARAG